MKLKKLLQKHQEKNKILPHKGIMIQINDVPSETTKARRVSHMFIWLKERKCQPKIIYPEKLPAGMEVKQRHSFSH